LNKEEYDNLGENSDDQQFNYENENVYEQANIENEQYTDVRHAGLQTCFVEEEGKHMVQYTTDGYNLEQAVVDADDQMVCPVAMYNEYGNSPIQENENEQYSTPDGNQVYGTNELDNGLELYEIANEVKKKDQSRKFVLWECNEMRNKWDEKIYNNKKVTNAIRKMEHHWNNDIQRESEQFNLPKSNTFDY
jgi:hypothetical protein